MTDPFNNPKDPLLRTGPERQVELLRTFGRAAHGHSAEDVAAAAISLVINVVRQKHPTRPAAEQFFDALVARSKGLLVDHYDALGRKRGVFPYDQVIMPRRFMEPR